MTVELRLLDEFKLINRINVNFACSYSEDDRLFIIGETGIYIVALRGYLLNTSLNFSWKKDFLKVSEFMPSANIDIDINNFHNDLEQKDLYETTMAIEYSGNLNHTLPVDPVPLSAQWSPRGLVGKTDCMLAVLTNLGSLEIYVKYLDENEIVNYVVACNVSQAIIEVEKTNWTVATKFSNSLKLNELKKRVRAVTPTVYTWTHSFKINGQETCGLCVGHMDGAISVWKINMRPANSKEQSKLNFLGKYTTQLKRITTMYWHQTTEFGGGLCFADSDGKMNVLHVEKLDQEEVKIDSELAFWAEADKVLVDKIMVITHDNRTYILVVKQSYLIIYGISESGDVFCQKVCHIGNYYITGLYHIGNTILILTMSGVFKQYTLSVEKEEILLEEKIIPLKIDASRYRTHGFFFSNNRVIFGLLAHPCHLRSFSKGRSFIHVFLYHNSLVHPFEALWYNNTGSLANYWDCFEVLRLICLKDKRFPWLGLPPYLNYDNLTLLQLKTLRLVAKLSEMVFNNIPIVRSYDIKPYIILHYLVDIKLIVKRINNLLNISNSGKYLSIFQMRSIDIQNFFLKEMVVKNILAKANVGKNFISEMRHIISIANELRYPPMIQCMWCGEKIIGPLCLPPHADSRCAISMMPIFLVPAYKCPFCKVLVHQEIEKEQDPVLCPYCDIAMEIRVLNDNVYKEFTDYTKESDKDYTATCEGVKSACFNDCLKEDINFNDIEENESDYIIFSDSDSEDTTLSCLLGIEDTSDKESKLRTLYAQMAGMRLEEIVRQDNEGGEKGQGDVDEPQPGPSAKVPKLDVKTE